MSALESLNRKYDELAAINPVMGPISWSIFKIVSLIAVVSETLHLYAWYSKVSYVCTSVSHSTYHTLAFTLNSFPIPETTFTASGELL